MSFYSYECPSLKDKAYGYLIFNLDPNLPPAETNSSRIIPTLHLYSHMSLDKLSNFFVV